MHKITISLAILLLMFNAQTTLSDTFNDIKYNQDDYIESDLIENGDTYCTPKKTIKDRIKNAFIGQPTGFTPQIQPSPYLNPNFGPSYMQGYYSGNVWNSHNMYYPAGGARVFGTSF